MSKFLDPRFDGLAPYTPGEQPPERERLIKLNTNENPFPPSPRVLAAVNRQLAAGLRLYPDPSCRQLRQAAAVALGVEPRQVLAGNGSDEVLAFLFQGFCPQGAVFPDLSYGFYPVFCRLYQRPFVQLPLTADFSLDVAAYAGRPETVFIANPNAPTGRLLPLSGVRQLLEQDSRRLVVVDEAYIDFGGDSALALLPDYDNLVIVRTLSKSRQLAGARLGLAVAGAALIADLERIKASFNPYSVNSLAMAAGVAALEDEDYFRACCRRVIANRELVSDGLRQLGFAVLPSQANFIFATPPDRDGGWLYQELRRRRILVRYFDQDRCRDYLRISVGTEQEMRALLAACREIFNVNEKEME